MMKIVNLVVIAACLAFVTPAFSYSSQQSSNDLTKSGRSYDRNFRKNYKKYRTFSNKKKLRMQRLNKSVRGLSPEQKKQLRERILNKKKPNY